MADLTLWGTPIIDDAPGLHTWAARRVKEACDWFARSTGVCWARLDTIARRAGVALRTAQKWVSMFARWGWITVTRRGRRSAYRSVTAAAPCASACALKPPRTICLEDKMKKPSWGDGARARGTEKTPAAGVKPGSLPSLDRGTLRDPRRLGTMLAGFLGAYSPAQAQERARDPRTLLRWFGLARRALRVGKNPGALFRTLLAGRRYDWISQADEDGARQDVAAFLHGTGPRRREWSMDDTLD